MNIRKVCKIAVGDTLPVGNPFSDKEVVHDLLDVAAVGGLQVNVQELLPSVVVEGQIAAINRARILKVATPGQIIYAQKELGMVKLLMNEALALLLLNHNGVVKIFEIGGVERQGEIETKIVPALRMEYIDNAKFFKETGLENDRQLEKFLTTFKEIVRIIDDVHKKQIIHRDLKPKNIILYVDGKDIKVKLIDFDLAKISRDDIGVVTGNETDSVIGTAEYMPPEQAEGLGVACVPSSDLYSLACIMYQVITGKLPIDFENTFVIQQKLSRILSDSPIDIRELRSVIHIQNEDFARTLLGMLSKNPSERPFQTASDFLAFLQKLDPAKLKTNPPLNI